jgi:hypothetical protein
VPAANKERKGRDLINTAATGLPIEPSSKLQLITERIILFTLVVYAVFAPHSIAITQGAYLTGATAWAVQLAASRSWKRLRTPVDISLFGFFACCVVSSFLSYEPSLSIKGLKSPAFFLAFYFVCSSIKSLRVARMLCFAIILSCLVNVAYSAAQLARGRGLKIDTIKQGSPLAAEGLIAGDVIVEADGQKIKIEEDLARAIRSRRGRVEMKYLRNESLKEASISRRELMKSLDAEGLGITSSPGRNFRISGFYSHYETYAEVLQMIAALAVGMLLAMRDKKSFAAGFLLVSVALLSGTLILTSTRAAMTALAVAVLVMAAISSGRRAVMAAMIAIILLAPVAMIALERSRGRSIFEFHEGSTTYRLKVWSEALALVRGNPVFGIGKGSEAKLKDKLGLYDNGRLPPGHFHSTPIQIATWWGLPALAFYFSFMAIFFVEMWRSFRRAGEEGKSEAAGIILGVMGALIAFNISSIVHFNFGDGEVVMHLWLMTGLAFGVRRLMKQEADAKSEHKGAPPSAGDSQKNPRPQQEAISESNVRAAGARSNSLPQ